VLRVWKVARLGHVLLSHAGAQYSAVTSRAPLETTESRSKSAMSRYGTSSRPAPKLRGICSLMFRPGLRFFENLWRKTAQRA
jgi:hypothetical protein